VSERIEEAMGMVSDGLAWVLILATLPFLFPFWLIGQTGNGLETWLRRRAARR
jgi:hypothetical protein